MCFAVSVVWLARLQNNSQTMRPMWASGVKRPERSRKGSSARGRTSKQYGSIRVFATANKW